MSQKTALYEAHVALDATMVDFGGFLMPMRYKKTSIVDEHMIVRNEVGMFDTSHMGRIWITGKDALDFIDYLVPRNIKNLSDYQSGYTYMLNEQGGFRDDVIISRFNQEEYMLVCNAGNLKKIWLWVNSFANLWKLAGKDLRLENRSEKSAMIAVQGPKAMSILESLANAELPDKRFRTQWITINNDKVLFSSTGYTGASGGELMIFADEDLEKKAIALWNLLLDQGVIPCALGSRDTLRMEAGYRLYGNDISEEINLLESGLDFVPFAHIDKETGFVGQEAVLALRGKTSRVFVGFKLLEKGIARHGNKVIVDGKEVGEVLSGTQSPLTKEPFGMALVPIELKELGSNFQIDIRGKLKIAEVVNFPIYDENKYGIKVRK
ncbi:MAG: glycine cleavage system aminomethyltransferase GcvT [Candidatus Heimdallarchaeota archaeon]|nr:glycine cleavage system aminomethyltransferase GcvT [Candidatus Heimdallarchaeota archaeon]